MSEQCHQQCGSQWYMSVQPDLKAGLQTQVFTDLAQQFAFIAQQC